MKTPNNKLSKNECLRCDIPPFSRNNYFTGKLLTERDFTAEQQYMADKVRLHQVALHGWGVVCGLKVKPHPFCPELRIVVEPGQAIDGCGREIRVPREKELDLPSLEPSPMFVEYPYPGEPQESTQSTEEQRELHEPTLSLYVCLRYVEWPAEPILAPFDECACGSNGTKPNRILERYEIQILTKEPASFERVRKEKEEYDSDDSRAIYEGLFDGCPEPTDLDCIPLAVISDFTPGQKLKAESIHNRRCRRLLPSTTVLDRLIRCILKRISTRNLTKIIEIGWTHRGEYHTHDFLKLFVGEHESAPGFQITFDRPVRREGITERTFQAIAVRYPENIHGAGQPEVVPTRVRMNSTRTRAHLHINSNYAHERLDRTPFDLYLLLRCNLVVDDHGYPVDGDFLAGVDTDGDYVAVLPTGDGIAGGLFESWIRVGHRETHQQKSHRETYQEKGHESTA
jgi:hypothetical protein